MFVSGKKLKRGIIKKQIHCASQPFLYNLVVFRVGGGPNTCGIELFCNLPPLEDLKVP